MDFETSKQLYLTEAINCIKANKSLNSILFDQLNTDSSFTNYKVLFEEIKSLFMKIRESYQDNPSMKIKLFLIQLKDFKKSVNNKKDKFNILKKLILELEFSSFSDAYKECFTKGLDLLETGVDYFCSYTTRGLPSFNNNYQDAIKNQYAGNNIILDDWNKIHYVAKMIVDFYNFHGFNSFFDNRNIEAGDLIKDKVYTYCKKTAVFVQIIEQRSFYTEEEEFNWCFSEYKTYKDNVNLKYIFYKKAGLVRPENAGDDILNWYEFAATSEGVASTTISPNMSNLQIQDIVNKDAQIVRQQSDQVFNKFCEEIS